MGYDEGEKSLDELVADLQKSVSLRGNKPPDEGLVDELVASLEDRVVASKQELESTKIHLEDKKQPFSCF